MAGPRGWQYVDANWERYEAIMIDSLTLTPFDGAVEVEDESVRISLDIAPPSVRVLVFVR